jgi:hypothetical protein
MNYEQHRPSRLVKAFPLLIFGAMFFAACQGDLPDVLEESTFPKAKLEKLGTMLRNELLGQYDYLQELPPYDTSVYWYVQTLYNQATSVMHLDKQSPSNDKWDQERQWKVFIIKNEEERLAFTLPGGDFFISTGMLKSFKKDYELYALLSFEATVMNDGHLLAQWVAEYNSLTINNLIEGNEQPDPLTAEALAQAMTAFAFDSEVVEKVDKASIENTCSTSILSPLGLVPYLENPDFNGSKWLLTRPSYDGRTQFLPEMTDDGCAGRQQGSNYQRFVLNALN